MEESINVLGGKLESCSTDPMTGWFRDGCCNTDKRDFGRHVVCAVMTDVFLAFSKGAGNDLSSPGPGFSGLKEGIENYNNVLNETTKAIYTANGVENLLALNKN